MSVKSEQSNSSSKKITEAQNENFGNLFSGKSQVKPINLNAKKLDINFDCDDFFNQFDPTAVKKEEPRVTFENKVETNPAGNKETLIKFGSNTPVVEEKPKTSLDEYNSKKPQYT